MWENIFDIWFTIIFLLLGVLQQFYGKHHEVPRIKRFHPLVNHHDFQTNPSPLVKSLIYSPLSKISPSYWQLHTLKNRKKKLSKKLSNRKSRWSSPWPHIKSPYVHTIFIILKVLKSPWLKHQIPINPPYHYSTLVSGASSPLLGFCTSMDELVDHLKLLIEWMIH